MKKNYILMVVVLMLFLGISTVNAKIVDQYYYVNDNEIGFTKEQYDFFTAVYYDGYQASMTEEDLAYFNGSDYDINNIETVTYEDTSFISSGNSTRATSHETNAKKLKIVKVDATSPIISITATWKVNPAVRSYDLIGSRLSGTSYVSAPSSKINYSGGTILPSASKYQGSGFGASLKLPNSGTGIVASQTFSVNAGGYVYASYQHAKKSISLSDSQTFTISSAGLGGVFKFSSQTIRDKYDGMGGVYIQV